MEDEQYNRLMKRLLERVARDLETADGTALPEDPYKLKWALNEKLRESLRVHVGDDVDPEHYSVLIHRRAPLHVTVVKKTAIDLLGDVYRKHTGEIIA